MRILRLTSAVQKKLMRARQERDAEAERIASEIVDDVRRRGDAALFAWVKKLDGVDLRREGLWVRENKILATRKQVSAEFLRAVEHAARNARRVADKQLPKSWTLAVEPG